MRSGLCPVHTCTNMQCSHRTWSKGPSPARGAAVAGSPAGLAPSVNQPLRVPLPVHTGAGGPGMWGGQHVLPHTSMDMNDTAAAGSKSRAGACARPWPRCCWLRGKCRSIMAHRCTWWRTACRPRTTSSAGRATAGQRVGQQATAECNETKQSREAINSSHQSQAAWNSGQAVSFVVPCPPAPTSPPASWSSPGGRCASRRRTRRHPAADSRRWCKRWRATRLQSAASPGTRQGRGWQGRCDLV